MTLQMAGLITCLPINFIGTCRLPFAKKLRAHSAGVIAFNVKHGPAIKRNDLPKAEKEMTKCWLKNSHNVDLDNQKKINRPKIKTNGTWK